MIESGPERWAGLLVAFGVLLTLPLWFVARTGPRVLRSVLSVASAGLLVFAMAAAIGRASIIGYLVGYPELLRFGPDEVVPQWPFVGLAVGGIVVGLAIAVAARGRDREAASDGPEDGLVEKSEAGPYAASAPADAGDFPHPGTVPAEVGQALVGRPELIGEEPGGSAAWTERVLDRGPRARPGFAGGGAPGSFAVVALALALPIFGYGLGPREELAIGRITDVSSWDAASLACEGVVVGFALLFAALALGTRHVPIVGAGFLLVGAGQAVTAAFPDKLDSDMLYMAATGLVFGLLLPAALHLLRGVESRDAIALVGGVVLALAVTVASTALEARAARPGFGASDSLAPMVSPYERR